MTQSNVLSLAATLPQPVIRLNDRKLVSHQLVGNIFQISNDWLVDCIATHPAEMRDDVYVMPEDGVVYLNGTALVALMKVLPQDIDMNGLGFLALLLDGDPALTEIQADFIRDMTGEKRGLS